MMKSILNKPIQTRQRMAFVIVFVITAIIFLFWAQKVFGIFAHPDKQMFSSVLSPFSTLTQTISENVSSLKSGQ